MKKQIVVEDLLEEDKEAVRQLLLKSYAEYEMNYQDSGLWELYLDDIYHAVDNPNVDITLVAKHDSVPVGSIQLFQSSDQAYEAWDVYITAPIIRFLAVDPDARGLGVAQELLKGSIAYARGQHASSIYLHTNDAMEKAIQLYEWIGFKRDQTKDYVKEDLPIKCYRYDL